MVTVSCHCFSFEIFISQHVTLQSGVNSGFIRLKKHELRTSRIKSTNNSVTLLDKNQTAPCKLLI